MASPSSTPPPPPPLLTSKPTSLSPLTHAHFTFSFRFLPTPSSTVHCCSTKRPILSLVNSCPEQWVNHEKVDWGRNRKVRGDAVVVRAGPPSTSNYIFALVFPLSLIIGTVFASIRISDRLEEQYLEELEINKAILEEQEAAEDEEEGEDDGEVEEENVASVVEDERPVEVAALPRMRNRPKKEV